VLCNPTNFSFNPKSAIVAKISRNELGDFDSLVLGLLLMSHGQGQVVVPDLGFYGRDFHSRLVREERLTAGVNYLDDCQKDCAKASYRSMKRCRGDDRRGC
jgi:hypothetical protein